MVDETFSQPQGTQNIEAEESQEQKIMRLEEENERLRTFIDTLKQTLDEFYRRSKLTPQELAEEDRKKSIQDEIRADQPHLGSAQNIASNLRYHLDKTRPLGD